MSSAAGLVELSGAWPRPVGDDVHVARALALDTSAWIALRYDRREAARRAACGLGAVPTWDLLDTLMDLPAGLPVPAAALAPAARSRVFRAPTGVARVHGTEVTRDLVPAVTPLLAIVATRDWKTGLTRASRFAPYCRRMVIGPSLPLDGNVLPTAFRLGIGVAVRSAHGASEVLLESQPVNDWRPTTAWWRFCEVVYGHAAQAAG